MPTTEILEEHINLDTFIIHFFVLLVRLRFFNFFHLHLQAIEHKHDVSSFQWNVFDHQVLFSPLQSSPSTQNEK